MNNKTVQLILRVAIFGEFLGHGVFALQGKAQWLGWIQKITSVDVALATKLLFIVGVIDITLAIFVLIKPIRPILLWMAFWGFFTAVVRPLVGESFWDFIERWANWGAPLALFLLLKQSKKE